MLFMATQGKVLRRIGNIRDIDDDKISRVEVEGRSIILVRKGKYVDAIDSVCGEGCKSLCDGILEGFFIRCPWYHEYYDIRTGKPLGVSHCKSSIRVYENRVNETNGDIFVYIDANDSANA